MINRKFGSEVISICPTLPKDWYEDMLWEIEREANKGPVKVFTQEEIEAYEEELRREGRL
jgi:hypothetical protein